MSKVTLSPAFWHGKKVFVTGHTGFKGSWLTEILLTLGADVTGYALAPPTTPNHFDLLNLGTRMSVHHVADIRDLDALTQAIVTAQPDIILHLAAQPIVRLSYDEPVETFDINVMGTVNLLQAARKAENTRACVVVTSDKCYLNEDTGKMFDENDKLGGADPYSASKAAAEIVAYAYNASYFKKTQLRMATVRAGNVIGGGDWAADRLIPDVARAAANGTSVHIRSPHATRPWQHVLEPLRGYLLLAEKLYQGDGEYREGWNFGPLPEDIQSVSVVLTSLKEYLPFDLQLDTAPQPHEAQRLGLDVRKAAERLGWSPQLTLKDAIRMTGAWYKAHIDGQDMPALSRQQIKEYFNL